MSLIDGLKKTEQVNFFGLLITLLLWLFVLIIVVSLEYIYKLQILKNGHSGLLAIHQDIIIAKQQQSFIDWVNKNSKEEAHSVIKTLDDIFLLFSGELISFVVNILTIIIVSILLFYINWKLSIAVSILLPAFAINYIIWKKELREHYQEYRNSGNRHLSNIVEFFQTYPLMQIYCTKEYETELIEKSFKNVIDKLIIYTILLTKQQSVSRWLQLVAPIYLIFIAYIFLHYKLASIGEIIGFWGLFALLINSITACSNVIVKLTHALDSYQKVLFEIKKAPSSIIILPKEQYIERITCIGTKYSYENYEKSVINIPEFTFIKGKWVEIIGASGCGKTTLVRALLKLIEFDDGIIKVNNIPINKIDYKWYYKRIGYVEQNGYLYSRTLEDNILLGRKYNKPRWNWVLTTASLHKLIEKFPKREKQNLGENSIKISGGERQRILIARALYHQPEWLILDEPFTGIDEEQRYEISALINSLKNNDLTVILITHDINHNIKIDQKLFL